VLSEVIDVTLATTVPVLPVTENRGAESGATDDTNVNITVLELSKTGNSLRRTRTR